MRQVKGLNPGRLDKRVTILRYQDYTTELKGRSNELVPVKTVWAELRPLRGTEGTEYFRDVNTQGYKVTMRFTEGVDVKSVIEYKGRQFKIQYIVNPLEYDYMLEVYCTEDLSRKVRQGGMYG